MLNFDFFFAVELSLFFVIEGSVVVVVNSIMNELA